MSRPQQIAHELDVQAQRAMFRRMQGRRRNWRSVLGQFCILAAILGVFAYVTWSAVADLGSGIIR